MFKTYCGDCGNSWYIGNPRTCTCSWKDALKRGWVGLTEKEVLECRSANHLYFYKAIEAKLKEKNNVVL